MPLWKRPWFELRVAAVWVFLGWERIGLARGMDADGKETKQDNNFTVTGAKSVSDTDIGVAELMDLCLAENDRRFSGYDRRLLRPTTMPSLVRFARLFMRTPESETRPGHGLGNAHSFHLGQPDRRCGDHLRSVGSSGPHLSAREDHHRPAARRRRRCFRACRTGNGRSSSKNALIDRHWFTLWRQVVGTVWDLVVDFRGSALSYAVIAKKRAIKRRGPGRMYEQCAAVLKLKPAPPARGLDERTMTARWPKRLLPG